MLGAAECWKRTGSKRPRLKVYWYLDTQDTCPSIFSRHQCKLSQVLGSHIELLCLGECWWGGRKDSSSSPVYVHGSISPRAPSTEGNCQQQSRISRAGCSSCSPTAGSAPAAPCSAPAPPEMQPACSGLPVPWAHTSTANPHPPCPASATAPGLGQPPRERSARSPRLLPLERAALAAGKWDAPTPPK